ncbi:hypothetical protein BDZ97DRAFT_2002747 [Flammula alnicola]|nr:hypothetical protein BDZ97DRAFT_2002747 [Flammula alnicola]
MPKSNFFASFKRKRILPRSNRAAATSANTATSDTPASPDIAPSTSDIPVPPTPNIEGPGISESRTDRVLSTTQTILTVLKGVGALAPVPFLKDSIDLASSLVDMVQNVNQNHEDLENVIREICQLLVCISSECARFQQSGESMPKEFTPMVEALVNALQEVESLCKTCTSQSKFMKFMKKSLVKRNITQIRAKLEHIFKLFDVSAVVSQVHFLAACRNDNKCLLREIREVLDSLRDMSLYRPPAKSSVSPVRVQLYHGSQMFEKLVNNRNIDDDPAAESRTTPIQAYYGDQIFKGPVTNTNVVKFRRR